ncbi:MAG: efflux RND transporter periplasmic adaptor subunit [Verrucomicrobiae bacterium]|nr:efflux RND transporter periplasmic adaptor subunit [Verrucomicrobiae bacterium]
MNTPSSAPPPAPLGRIVSLVLVLVIIGLAIGLVPRWLARQKLLAETRADFTPSVDTVFPVPAKTYEGTPLPAEVLPFVAASIHARASGYLKSWFVDIGDQVTNHQVLAEIDTPELDEQITQARAELDQAAATRDLAQITADRWTELLKTASVSEQETAEKKSDYVLKQANVEAARANVQRLEDLKRFDLVTAPFDGVITLRNTDIGQLIAADSGPELFRLAQVNPLRVYVRVPQQLTHGITPGQKGVLTLQDLPGREFAATVSRTAGAVDATSRTLQVELLAPNPRGEILSGSYAQVRFTEGALPTVLTLSDSALIFRAQGMQAAVVDASNKVQLRSLTLGRDFGSTVEVLAGLDATNRVIMNPPDGITDGMLVHIAPPAETNQSNPLK